MGGGLVRSLFGRRYDRVPPIDRQAGVRFTWRSFLVKSIQNTASLVVTREEGKNLHLAEAGRSKTKQNKTKEKQT